MLPLRYFCSSNTKVTIHSIEGQRCQWLPTPLTYPGYLFRARVTISFEYPCEREGNVVILVVEKGCLGYAFVLLVMILSGADPRDFFGGLYPVLEKVRRGWRIVW